MAQAFEPEPRLSSSSNFLVCLLRIRNGLKIFGLQNIVRLLIMRYDLPTGTSYFSMGPTHINLEFKLWRVPIKKKPSKNSDPGSSGYLF